MTLGGIHYLLHPDNKAPTMPGARKAGKAAVLVGAVGVVCGDPLTSMIERPQLHGGPPFHQPQNPATNKKIYLVTGNPLESLVHRTIKKVSEAKIQPTTGRYPIEQNRFLYLAGNALEVEFLLPLLLLMTLAGFHYLLHTNSTALTIPGARKAGKAAVLVGAVGVVRGDPLASMNKRPLLHGEPPFRKPQKPATNNKIFLVIGNPPESLVHRTIKKVSEAKIQPTTGHRTHYPAGRNRFLYPAGNPPEGEFLPKSLPLLLSSTILEPPRSGS